MELPTEIIFGNRKLEIPENITTQQIARLCVVLSFASSGVLYGASQQDVDSWLINMKVDNLFILNEK